MYTFSQRSLDNLSTCHEDLQKIAKLAMTRSKVDFGISEGHRIKERQKELFDQGLSDIDGISELGKHNYLPSLALDLYAYVPGKKKLAFDESHLAYIAGVFEACAQELYEKGEITHKLRWGGNWDGDGQLKFDQTLIDFPHHELID